MNLCSVFANEGGHISISNFIFTSSFLPILLDKDSLSKNLSINSFVLPLTNADFIFESTALSLIEISKFNPYEFNSLTKPGIFIKSKISICLN